MLWIIYHKSANWKIARYAHDFKRATAIAEEIKTYLRTVAIHTVKQPRVEIFSALDETRPILTDGQ